ncbi:MAG: hypothetical protein AB8G16_04550 [Gammaproteobacteria bacterium]
MLKSKSLFLSGLVLTLINACAGSPGELAQDVSEDANAAIAASVPSTDIVLVSLDAVVAQRDPGKALTVTARRGYDNQPAFSLDGRHLYFSSIANGGQSDVYRFDIATKATRQITHTTESEYSPTPLADGGFTCIQVAMDGTQRLWRYGQDGTPQRALRPDVTGVGYHAWLSAQELALFIVAEPMRLEIATATGNERTTIATDIGRSVLKTPDGDLSFVQGAQADKRTLMQRDARTGALHARAALPGPGEDLVWLSDGSVLVANARTLYRLAPDAEVWTEWVNLARSVAGDITRMAVDPTGRWLALVVSESE